ncbi:MAG: MBL fold metallo-hydrolase, partial [Candidatus Thorarchaeota archaeon]
MKKNGATVISHEYSADIIVEESDIPNNRIAKMIKRTYTQEVFGEVVLSRPDQTITQDTILDLGEEIHLLVVPGHTPGDIAVYHPRSKVLFAGDAILEGMNPYVRQDSIDIKIWIKNLQRLKKLNIEWILPGHGELSKPEIIDSNILYLKNGKH